MKCFGHRWGFKNVFPISQSELTSVTLSLVFSCSDRWRGALRGRGTLLGSRCGSRLLQRDSQRARSLGHLLHSHGGLCLGPPHPAALTRPALPTSRPLWRDHRRVLAGPPPHQVTNGKRAIGQGTTSRAQQQRWRRTFTDHRHSAQNSGLHSSDSWMRVWTDLPLRAASPSLNHFYTILKNNYCSCTIHVWFHFVVWWCLSHSL